MRSVVLLKDIKYMEWMSKYRIKLSLSLLCLLLLFYTLQIFDVVLNMAEGEIGNILIVDSICNIKCSKNILFKVAIKGLIVNLKGIRIALMTKHVSCHC